MVMCGMVDYKAIEARVQMGRPESLAQVSGWGVAEDETVFF